MRCVMSFDEINPRPNQHCTVQRNTSFLLVYNQPMRDRLLSLRSTDSRAICTITLNPFQKISVLTLKTDQI